MQTLPHLCLHQLCLFWLALCILVYFVGFLPPKLDSHLDILRDENQWKNISCSPKRGFFAIHN